MNRPVVSAVTAVVAIMMVGCATYKAQMVNADRVEAYQNMQEVGGIAVAVEPYDTAEKAKSAFYVDVTSKNIKPVQVIIDNKSDDSILVTRSEIHLLGGSGSELKPVNSNYVYGRFEKNELAYAFWGFGIFSYMSAQEANDKMKADWYEKELPEERTIQPKRRTTGFVFFESSQHLKGMTLSLNLLNLRTNQYSKIDVPIR